MKKKIAAITVLVMVALLCEAGCIGTNIGNRHQAKRKLWRVAVLQALHLMITLRTAEGIIN